MRPVFDRAPTWSECVIDALFYREIPDKEEPMRVESVEHVASAPNYRDEAGDE